MKYMEDIYIATKRTFSTLLIAVFVLGLLIIMPLHAHKIEDEVYATIEIEGRKLYFVNLLFTQVDSHLFYAGYPEYRDEIKEHIKIFNNNSLCSLDNFLTHTESTLSNEPYFFVASCKRKIENLIIQDSYPLHEHTTLIYTIRYGNDAIVYTTSSPTTMSMKIEENRLQKVEGEAPFVQEPSTTWDSFLTYLQLGIVHILAGIEYILFILGFILLSHNVLALIRGIIGFTIAHSTTLILSSLSLFTFPLHTVELFIAITVVLIGILAFIDIPRPRSIHLTIIVIAGLFHGLGFSESIVERGLPPHNVFSSLIGFNLGIEIGQVFIVCALYLLLRLARQMSSTRYNISVKICAGSIVLGGIALIIQRILL